MDLFHLGAIQLIQTIGYLGIFAIVFVESGVPFGAVIPLPGDTLLFSAGLLAATGSFALLPLSLTIAVAAVAGGSVGYWSGATFGTRLFSKEHAWFMNPRTLNRMERFFSRYGARSLVLARFIPILRTVAPIGAGIARMPYGTFLRWNIVGALLWTVLVTALGYFLGRLIPNPDAYILPLIGVIVILSAAGALREILAARKDA